MTQEPWCMKMNGCKTKCEDCPDEPPQSTWVGLSEQDINELKFNLPDLYYWVDVVRATEKRLKEKNT
jgi:hypothetical protein